MMEYIKNFEQYNYEGELIIEGVNLKSMIDMLKTSINKIGLSSLIAGSLLTIFTTTEAIHYIKKLSMDDNDKKIIINTITKYKNPLTLNVSDDCYNHIKNHEKLKLKAYKISDGKITIGYGHAEPKRKSKYRLGHQITELEANQLLMKDLSKAVGGVKRMFKEWEDDGINIKLTQSQFDVLVSMAFNMGITGLRQTDFIQSLKKKDLKTAAELIKKTGISDKFPGLEKRRLIEYKKFLS